MNKPKYKVGDKVEFIETSCGFLSTFSCLNFGNVKKICKHNKFLIFKRYTYIIKVDESYSNKISKIAEEDIIGVQNENQTK
jgi:hypothetical protein